jgi:DNA polymerase iota
MILKLPSNEELAIVNGEDLARYRVASKGIFHLVRSLVTDQKVERLGLDELFIGRWTFKVIHELCPDAHFNLEDVTDMMEAHLTELGWNGDPGSTTALEEVQTFRIPSNGQSFTYNPYKWIGFKIDNNGDRMSQSSQSQERLSWQAIKLHAASHLASYIRNQIKERLGFTCSAGIATCKIFAKLAADVHKPNEQTLLCPDKYAEFLEPLHIRKIMGIGYKASRTLCKKLGLLKDEHQANEEDTLDDVEEAAQEGEAWHLPELTVSYVQQHCTIQQFLDWFGDRQGPVLWDLIHGIDNTQVISTPLIPTQISIEDSFRHCKTMADATARLHDLAIDFIKRLEVELRVKDEFVKYPTTLRLTTRNRGTNDDGTWRDSKGLRDTRISKSSRMPVDVFDISRSIPERASALVEQSLLPMLKNLVKEPFALTL